MPVQTNASIPDILRRDEKELLAEWMQAQLAAPTLRADLLPESELRRESTRFLRLFREAAQRSGLADTQGREWDATREMLAELSRAWALQGFSTSETATFIFSLKQPLLSRILRDGAGRESLADEIWTANRLIDELGLYTTEVYQKAREEVVFRQQQELLELSTPVIKLWDGILAVPVIGTLDSARTQLVMEALLQMLLDTGSQIAIIDITGVPTVDTLVAQHLLKTVAATRLMGAECIISGIRPRIAQTIVHLGVELQEVVTKATLADAFRLALQRLGANPRKDTGG